MFGKDKIVHLLVYSHYINMGTEVMRTRPLPSKTYFLFKIERYSYDK